MIINSLRKLHIFQVKLEIHQELQIPFICSLYKAINSFQRQRFWFESQKSDNLVRLSIALYDEDEEYRFRKWTKLHESIYLHN